MRTFYHDDQALHHPCSYFSRGKMRTPQEVPTRIDPLLAAVASLNASCERPGDAGMGPIAEVHTQPYLRFLESAHRRWPEDWGGEVMSNVFVREPNALRGVLAEAGRYLADGSAPLGEFTWQAAYASAQSAIAAADTLIQGERQAYALCRPPGHHARADAAGGFCYLNNAAIAAQRLSHHHSRIAILDTDMHHGQGIQEIFYTRDDVLYVSIHGDPTNFYPAACGFEDERGQESGYGYNLNLPMPHGASEADFFARLDEACRAVALYAPDVLILALGFDIYTDDPQAKVSVSTEGFAQLGQIVAGFNLPTLVIQEGGYAVDSLEVNARSFFRGLLG
ncbi:histone deacetylase family protein [Halomonas sp. McH1-25]|uniref:histone deacetylase family protein n=1 Tax=unclassified Halomonas TaxID=2609666 RepID=UPI001EF47D73|nr:MULTISPECIES: histone deacetylase family protein [unclassified Halomonas]MCG7601663.1 histone deacetylase family protein [Halomonas sp. McH1-25]MCP1342216.1 histone deacetylase family protein [Halomonas sp. FL8]MCP1360567.1 histone deacetylase family protein [Halomonas sp. BBD45]MCP1365258.1 histone deacetylase family protein [Halomonas sp. BBD48]